MQQCKMAGLLTVNLCAVRPPLEKTGAAPTDGPLSLCFSCVQAELAAARTRLPAAAGKNDARGSQPVPAAAAVNLKYADVNCRAFTFSGVCVCVHLECVYEGDFFLRELDLVSCGVTQRLFFQMALICLSPRTWSRNFQKSNVHTRSKRAAAQRCGAALLTGTTTQDLGQLRSQRVMLLLIRGFWSNWLDFEW